MKTYKKRLIGTEDETCELTLQKNSFTVTYTFDDSEMALQQAQDMLIKKLYVEKFKTANLEKADNVEEINVGFYKKEFADYATALKEANKLISSKTKKGYQTLLP